MGFSLRWSNVSAVPDWKGSRTSAGRHVREQAALAPGVTSVLDPVYYLQVSVDDSCKIYHLLRCEIPEYFKEIGSPRLSLLLVMCPGCRASR